MQGSAPVDGRGPGAAAAGIAEEVRRAARLSGRSTPGVERAAPAHELERRGARGVFNPAQFGIWRKIPAEIRQVGTQTR